jgi:hypothetical protein
MTIQLRKMADTGCQLLDKKPFSLYSKRCYSVPVTQPRESFRDVTASLKENRIRGVD